MYCTIIGRLTVTKLDDSGALFPITHDLHYGLIKLVDYHKQVKSYALISGIIRLFQTGKYGYKLVVVDEVVLDFYHLLTFTMRIT
jgi:hypothetical protein